MILQMIFFKKRNLFCVKGTQHEFSICSTPRPRRQPSASSLSSGKSRKKLPAEVGEKTRKNERAFHATQHAIFFFVMWKKEKKGGHSMKLLFFPFSIGLQRRNGTRFSEGGKRDQS
jgi:hypothetical protein